ncbi:hypothetical protein Daesc_004396 [Daldinia eschscholtzii]|uniref:Uncharacterized protein n=1 Tax=Daldinia eschscholtzii TaxID=292717 RepID=A0AAX6MP83_9PEZI
MNRVLARDDVRVPSVVTTGLIVVSTVFPFLSAVALILRSHALRAHPRPFGAEDFCCVVAAIVRLVLLTKSLDEIDNNFSHIYLQNTIYIFKVIEPNASIVAACLPCYGPLIKSWRTPESIVRSVRSLVSISSGGSRGSRKRSPLHVQQGENSVGESQIELNTFANISEQERANKVPTPGTNTVEI